MERNLKKKDWNLNVCIRFGDKGRYPEATKKISIGSIYFSRFIIKVKVKLKRDVPPPAEAFLPTYSSQPSFSDPR